MKPKLCTPSLGYGFTGSKQKQFCVGWLCIKAQRMIILLFPASLFTDLHLGNEIHCHLPFSDYRIQRIQIMRKLFNQSTYIA